jgi:hypothetical protein
MSDRVTVAHVVRRRWEWELLPFWHGVWNYRAPKNGGAVRAFASAERAERFRLRLERRTRERGRKPNPFLLCRAWDMDYALVTSLPEFAFLDWVRDVVLEPPVPYREGLPLSASNWYHWWQKTEPGMSPEQREHLWRGLDRVAFYAVVPLELE